MSRTALYGPDFQHCEERRMSETASVGTEPQEHTGTAPADHLTDLVEADDLVEEVSIDGMCGVY
ncbi:mycofactocin precursor MftA [Streptomyces sp. NPDC057376]|uniref:mycofactocin precursor MftA n=1 Tax=unclassified Streptomyces TaxID=2593676 RepID=UPI0009A0DA0F|nr:mycofactocin precursor MftA [Streptomyces sp. CB02414]